MTTDSTLTIGYQLLTSHDNTGEAHPEYAVGMDDPTVRMYKIVCTAND